MMKAKYLFILFLLLAPSITHAQMDSKVITGVVSYEGYQYEKALEHLNLALADPGQLKAKTVPKAYYYRGMTYVAILREAALANDEVKLNTYADGYIIAFQDFLKVTELPEPNKFIDKAVSQLTLLESSMLQGALNAVSSANNASSDIKKNQLYKLGMDYCNAVIAYNGNYLAWDIQGQCHQGLGDSNKAHEAFATCISAFSSTAPERADAYMGYVYYRKALIEFSSFGHVPAAIETVRTGLEFVQLERGRFSQEEFDTPDFGPFDQVKSDLETLELDLYLNSSPVPEEAFEKFERAVERDPSNATLILAYASLMERRDTGKAIELYKQAIELDPDGYLAHYNLGALYVNHAVQLNQQAVEIVDNAEYEKAMDDVRDYMRKALPHLEKAHEGSPDEINILDAIINVCIQLEEMDKFKIYKEKKAALLN